ncbi:ATP-dependent Clp protease proteolytic subunit, partial [Clostridium perfringens]|uniref:ATP-dependent Clp protease proteolytic subunit n=1 Tax=Clostridium perfringens TaxID=1502 RepID=UPI0037542925
SNADINIYIDGIAASMASVIALCGKHVEMSKYARLMLHSVSGGCYGNKKDMQKCIDEITSLEDTLCDMYSAKTGMSKEDIHSKYFDGEDHWLT